MGKKSRRPKVSKKGTKKAASNSKKKSGNDGNNPPSIVTYTPDTSNFGPVPSPASVIHFWNWFKVDEDILRELPQEEASTRIEFELKEVNHGLTLKLDAAAAAAATAMMISANGVTDCFNAVLSLIHFAPQMDQWTFTAFSGRHSNPNDLAIQFEDGQTYEYPAPDRIKFAFCAEDRTDKVGIGLFFDEDVHSFGEIDEEYQDFLKLVGLMYLANLLGEYDYDMHVGILDFRTQKEMRGVHPQWMDHTSPLKKLVHEFDECLEGKIGRSRPKDGWSALVNVDLLLDDVQIVDSRTSAAADIEHEVMRAEDIGHKDSKDQQVPKNDFDPRSDFLSELGLSNEDGLAGMGNMDKRHPWRNE